MRKLILLVLASAFLAPLALADKKAALTQKHQDILAHYCYECHDDVTQEGQINLESLSLHISEDIRTAETWNKVLDAINSGEMPPKKREQITAQEKTFLLRDLSEQMVVARDILSDSGGLITARRLNRREYQNSLEHVLGITPDIKNIPKEAVGRGFDTSGSSLFISSDQFEQYFKTALSAVKATHRAYREQPKTQIFRVEPEDETYPNYAEEAEKYLKLVKGSLAYLSQEEKQDGREYPPSHFGITDENTVKLYRAHQTAYRVFSDYLSRRENLNGVAMFSPGGPRSSYYTPRIWSQVGGKYILRFRGGAYPDAPEHRRYIEYGTHLDKDRISKRLGHLRLKGTVKKPEITEITIDHFPQTGLRYYVTHRDYDIQSDRWKATQVAKAEGHFINPGVWLDYMEVEGPILDGSTKSAFNLFPEGLKGESLDTRVRRLLKTFATRAFRDREPSDIFLDALFKRYQAKRNEGLGYFDALYDAYALILSSPNFLYMLEPAPEGKKHVITDRELAIRLSYLIWSAPPDEELLELARDKKLSQPKVLQAQTERLLASRRSDQFIHSFIHQWLHMERLDTFDFNSMRYPDFDGSVRAAARLEIYETVRHHLDKKLPLGSLLKSNFVVINDLLAGYYGIEGVEGSHFRPVKVPEGMARGGLLSTAAVLVMGSDGQRTSPVERGAWVLRYLLNDPPPPAPPNIPMLSRISESLDARSLQKVHQEQPQCAQCHEKIDPIGFALENFDAAGKWRDKDIDQKFRSYHLVTEKIFDIDPSGTLSSGEKFANFQEFRDLIASKHPQFAMGFTKHLIAYGLGRPYSFSDEKLAHEITAAAAKNGNHLEAFIHALVQSKRFRQK